MFFSHFSEAPTGCSYPGETDWHKNRKLKATANNNQWATKVRIKLRPVWKHNRAQAGPQLRIAETVLAPNRLDIEESSEQVTENTYKSSLQPYLPAQIKWQDPEGLPSHGTADPPESFPSVNKLYLRQPSDHRLHSCDRGVERRILTKTNSPQATPQFRTATENKSQGHDNQTFSQL